MSILEEVREHAGQIQAHVRTAQQKLVDHAAAHPEDAALVTEATKVLSEAATDAVDTLKAGQKAAPPAASGGGEGGGTQQRRG